MQGAVKLCLSGVDCVMNKIVWTEEFSLGVEKLDQQHRELFSIVNELIENQDATATSELLEDVLFRVCGYAAYHFRTEERVMKEYGYPGYASQVSEHAAFRVKAAGFCADAIAGKNESGLLGEMLEYLHNWLFNHILESDLVFKNFLIQNGFLRKP
jgi:hemerythrin-like metal-binding protein